MCALFVENGCMSDMTSEALKINRELSFEVGLRSSVIILSGSDVVAVLILEIVKLYDK